MAGILHLDAEREAQGEPVYPARELANFMAFVWASPTDAARELGLPLARLANIHPGSSTVH